MVDLLNYLIYFTKNVTDT